MNMDTDKFRAICNALGSEVDPDAAVRAALAAKQKIGRWEQFKRHMKGASKLALDLANEILNDDEMDELIASFIRRKQ